jgi:WD40 repeat protein
MSGEHYRQQARTIKDTRAQAKSNDSSGEVYAVAFTPDGTRVATASADKSARVFDAATGHELARLDHGC